MAGIKRIYIMGKKKINLLLLTFIFFSIDSYSQELFTKELQWIETKEFVNELYESMENFINDTTSAKVELPKLKDVGLEVYLYKFFSRKKDEKELTLQKQKEQEIAKKIFDTNFIIEDSIIHFCFQDKDQILEWGKNQLPFSVVFPEVIRIKDRNIFILRVAGCSGLPCWNIYIFKEKDVFWQLIKSTHARIVEFFVVNVDNDMEKIIFITKSGKILSELSFNILYDDF